MRIGARKSCTVFADPGQYEFLNCEQLAAQRTTRKAREQELKLLMDRAEQSTGGAFVNLIAYKSDYVTAQEDLNLFLSGQRASARSFSSSRFFQFLSFSRTNRQTARAGAKIDRRGRHPGLNFAFTTRRAGRLQSKVDARRGLLHVAGVLFTNVDPLRISAHEVFGLVIKSGLAPIRDFTVTSGVWRDHKCHVAFCWARAGLRES